MKSHSVFTAVCSAFLIVNAVHAQAVPSAREGVIEGSPITVSSPDRIVLPASELAAFQGQFQMVDGTTLTVTRRSRRLFVELSGQSEVELVATSRNSFVSAKGAMQLVFQQAENGIVFGVELRHSGDAA